MGPESELSDLARCALYLETNSPEKKNAHIDNIGRPNLTVVSTELLRCARAASFVTTRMRPCAFRISLDDASQSDARGGRVGMSDASPGKMRTASAADLASCARA